MSLGNRLNMVARLIKWVWRAWPVLILVALIFVHLLLIYYFCLNSEATNKTISLLAQITGGILVLYSIDSNIEIFKGRTLIDELISYFKSFPLIKRSGVIQGRMEVSSTSSMTAKVTVNRNKNTVDERIDYLQEQIDDLNRECDHNVKELHKKVDGISEEIGEKISQTNATVKDVEAKVEKASIGGIKIQLLGVFLIIYGSISGYIA